jgi:hypothetical protein
MSLVLALYKYFVKPECLSIEKPTNQPTNQKKKKKPTNIKTQKANKLSK